MAGYKNGSIIVTILSFILIIAGIFLFYIGNDRLVISGSKVNGNTIIEKTDMKLYFIPVGSEIIEGVKKVKLQTQTDENKKLVKCVIVFSDSTKLVLADFISKLDSKSKIDLHNDLDFFIKQKSSFSSSYSFTTHTGLIGLIIIIVFALTFFSMLMHLLNRKLVEKDQKKSIRLEYSSAFALVMGTKNNSGSGLEQPLGLMKIEGKTIIQKIVDLLTFKSINKIGVMIDTDYKKKFKMVLAQKADLIEVTDPLNLKRTLFEAEKWADGLKGEIILLPGDKLFITEEIIEKLIKEHRRTGNICTILTTDLLDEGDAYIQRNTVNKIKDIVQERNDNKELDSSVYCFTATFLFKTNNIIKTEAKSVHDIIRYIINDKQKVGSLLEKDLKI